MKYLVVVVLAIVFSSSVTLAQVTVTLDPQKTYQTIDGFGGFGAKKVWWSSPPYHDAEYLNQIIDNLGSTIVRTQIYWDGEPVNDNSDPLQLNQAGFNFGPSSDNGKQFPFLRDLHQKGAKLIATVWTPPVWMKLYDMPARIPNECYNCTTCAPGSPGRAMCGGRLNPEHYDEFAEYLVAYVRTLKQETGIDLYGISIQNEPYFANPFESNVVMPDEYADILKVVGARFRSEGLTTKFFGPEHMAEWSWGWQQKYVQESLGDAEARQYLDIYAVHSYVDGVAPDYGSADGWTSLYQNITVAYGKPLWMTETSDFSKTGFPLALSMSKSLYLALRFGNISGWVYWAMADAVIVNNQLTPLGHAFKQFYRYVRPGAVRIDAVSNSADVLSLAFRHTGTDDVTIIMINQGSVTENVKLNIPFQHKPLTLYRTTATENANDIGLLPGTDVLLPPSSVSTVTTIAGSGVVGVKKNDESSLKIYPNPARGTFVIDPGGETAYTGYRITDALGRQVCSGVISGENLAEVDTKYWQSGAYFINIVNGHNSVVRKIIVD